MKRWICLLCSSIALGRLDAQRSGWQPSPGHTQVLLWTGTIPDAPGATADAESTSAAEDLVAGKPWIAVYHVSRPTLTVYAPQGDNTGAAVIVFPGGGYNILAIDLEGTEVCDWLTSKGITCVLLKYRVPRSGPQWNQKCRCDANPRAPLALEDAQRTVSLVRFHAAE
jgi:acetyl esterase/lipase